MAGIITERISAAMYLQGGSRYLMKEIKSTAWGEQKGAFVLHYYIHEVKISFYLAKTKLFTLNDVMILNFHENIRVNISKK